MLVLAIVVYSTLDFPLAAMPGAFVFDPADSVETVQSRNGRAGIDVKPLMFLTVRSLVIAPPADRCEGRVRAEPGSHFR